MIKAIQRLLDKLPTGKRNRIEAAFWSAYGRPTEEEPDQVPIAAEKIVDYIKEIVRSEERKAARRKAEEAFDEAFDPD